MEARANRWAAFRLPARFKPKLGWGAALFLGLALVALGLRLWELDGRAMHYDEGLHVHYAWRLATGDGYSHSPWMHGPLQIHLTALMFKLFSDSDFTARLIYVLFGSALVVLPYFLRTYLGRTGAVVTAVLLALSPTMLYFSRFGRNDILMAFWALALLILMWRYLNEAKNRYLYMTSAVLALAFATKETTYLLLIIFGAALFLMSLPEIIAGMLGRIRLSEMSGAPVFLLLLVTLTLPQWSALISIPLSGSGLELVSKGVGEVGLPVWGEPFISFPVVSLAAPFNALIIAAMVAIPLGAGIFTRVGRRWAKWLLLAGAVVALAYAFISFPNGVAARNYLVSFGVLAAITLGSVIIGMLWRWKVWLLCAGIFYGIWTFFYTSVFGAFVRPHSVCPAEVGNAFGTLCSKLGGVYTGSWQSLGYWLEQQGVARGGQPWYYHFVNGSVYEFLPLLFGVIAIIYYLRKGELFGLMLVFWAVLSFMAYTYASEKMPWLLVNMALPSILLAGNFFGELIDRINWRGAMRSFSVALLVLPPLLLLAGVYLLHGYLDQGEIVSWQDWGLLASIIIIAAASALLVLRSRPRVGVSLAALGVGVLLLGFSSFVSFRAAYTYDDSRVEMLVYAQGSADIVKTVDTLGNGVLNWAEDGQTVDVDYEMWYPFNWYVRHEQKDGTLGFRCYKNENEDGYVSWCTPLEEPPSTRAVLLIDSHARRDSDHLTAYEKMGPFRNLLWFPESYRRPGENRGAEGMGEEIKKDFSFVKDNITRREAWKGALDYFLHRRLGNNWWDSKYFAYIAAESSPSPPVVGEEQE